MPLVIAETAAREIGEANSSALRRPSLLGLRLPTMASCGSGEQDA